VFVVIRTNIWRIKNLEFRIWWRVRPLPMRVNLRWRSGNRQSIAPFGRMFLPVAMVLGLTGGSYILGPAVSERHALPTQLDIGKGFGGQVGGRGATCPT
jgi:hypothetical protein